MLVSSSTVKIYLTSSDAVALQLNRNFGKTSASLYNLVVSTPNNLLSGTDTLAQTSSPGTGVSVVTPDSIKPALTSFAVFDQNAGSFSLSFSKPIDVQTWNATSLPPGVLVFQNFLSVSSPADSFSVQQLTCPGCADGSNLTFVFPASELNRLKLTPGVCSSISVCWLTLPSPGGFVQDMSRNNNSLLPNGLMATLRLPLAFIYDTTGPVLQSFALNMSSLYLTLTFNEPVDVTSFNVSGITLQGGKNVSTPSLFYQLQSTVPQVSQGYIVLISLSSGDQNGILSRSAIATSVANTYLSMSQGTVADVTYKRNSAQTIPPTSALQVGTFVSDTIPPVLTAFDLDLNGNLLTLVFSEPVVVGRLNLTLLTVLSAPNSALFRQITGGVVQATSYSAAAVVSFVLNNADATFLKQQVVLATNVTNTYLAIAVGMATDTSNNTNVPASVGGPVSVRVLTLDTSSPILTGFSLDMNSGQVGLNFSDAVNIATFDVTSISLQGTKWRVATQWYSLTSNSYTLSSSGFSATVFMGGTDLNRVKQIRPLAKNVSTSYLTASAMLAQGFNGLNMIAVVDGKALLASSYVPDTTPPSLSNFTLDMNTGQLFLTFSEVVDILMLNASLISLQGSLSSSRPYPLTGFLSVVPSDADYRFAMQLTLANLNSIKQDSLLATSASNTFITMAMGAVLDMASNPVVPVLNGVALRTTGYTADKTSPTLQSFTLNLNTNLLQLTFSETVNATAFSVTGLTLVNQASQPSSSWTLNASLPTTYISNVVNVSLSMSDLNGIKASGTLSTMMSNTFIVVQPWTVADMSGNPVVQILTTSALQVSNYVVDTTPPQLASFGLDVGLGVLYLSFSETVRGSSFDPTQLTIQGSSGGGANIPLTGGVWAFQNHSSVTLSLTSADLNKMKAVSSGVAKSRNNTFIALTSATIRDTAGVSVTPIASTSARPASFYMGDLVPPQLLSFSLDLNGRNLYLTFDETVSVATLVIQGVGLQDDPSNAQRVVHLGALGTTAANVNYTVAIIGLASSDFNAITFAFPLASIQNDTFITLGPGTIKDTSGNPNVVIQPTNALRVSALIRNAQSPTLQSFDFDLNLGALTLTFSESVNGSSFQPMQVTLQSSSGNPMQTINLSGGLVSQLTSTSVMVDLLRGDLNSIKATSGLASQFGNTFVSITPAAVRDMSGNPVIQVPMTAALQVTTFTRDTTGPVLDSFDLDFNSGVLTLHFDEPVGFGALSTLAVTLSNQGAGGGSSYALTASSTSLDSGLLTDGRIMVGNGDLDVLKQRRICTAASCHLDATGSLVNDSGVNSNYRASLNVSLYTPDTTSPRVTSFVQFDMNTGTFTVQFSETMAVSSMMFSRVAFYNDYTNDSYAFTFTQLALVSPGDAPVIAFQIGTYDLNRLKLVGNVCDTKSHCWIRITSGFIADVSGNDIVPILPNTMATYHTPVNFVSDTTPPQMTSFAIDMNAGVMTFTFNEVVLLPSFNPTNLTFQDALSGTVHLQMNSFGPSLRSADGLSVVWNLSSSDLNLLKANGIMFTSLNTSYVAYIGLIQDAAGNAIAPRYDTINALRASGFIPDTTRPVLTSFVAYNLNNWSFTLFFNEPVNLNSIALKDIAISNNYTFYLSFYDPEVINSWYSLLLMNGSVFNLTHVFNPGEYILSCPFNISERIADASDQGSGSGMTPNQPYPFVLRGCYIVVNRTLVEPFYFLTGGVASYGDLRKQEVIVSMIRPDLKYLKLSTTIAVNDSTTFVAFNSTALADMAGNPVIPTSIFNATKLAAGSYVTDVTPPTLESFDLDLNTGVLSLHFSDVMNISSCVPTRVTLLQSPGSNDSYTLRGAYPVQTPNLPDYNISVTLADVDLNAIKADHTLATSYANTFLSVTSSVAADIYGHRTVQVLPRDAIQVRLFTPDATPPRLVNFTLDMNAGLLNLTFSEVVEPLTLRSAGIVLQNSGSFNGTQPFQAYRLTGGVPLVNTSSVLTLSLLLASTDVNAVTILTSLGTNVSNTYVLSDFGAVNDTNANPSVPISQGYGLQAVSVIPNTSPPSLWYFDLDLSTNQLTMRFSQAILPDSFMATSVTLLSAASSSDNLTLSARSDVVYLDYNSLIQVTLITADQNVLKNSGQMVAKTANSTYIAIQSTVCKNYIELGAVPILPSNPQQVRYFKAGECQYSAIHLFLWHDWRPVVAVVYKACAFKHTCLNKEPAIEFHHTIIMFFVVMHI